MIHVYLLGGLANRLRAIASAYKLAKEFGTHITVHWDINIELNSEFEKLFQVNDNIINVKNHNILSAIHIFSIIRAHTAHHIRKSICKIISKDKTNQNSFITQFAKSPQKTYRILTCYNFYEAHDYTFIKPVSFIDARVSTLLKDIDKTNLVGIQIRRTDHIMSITNSPTELFIEYMNKELESNPKTVFYLATDDINIRSQIIDLFQDKIIYTPTDSISRETQSGMIDAVIDFIALSRCHRIYGSYTSSFCEVASDIGNNELIEVKKLDSE